MSNITMLFETNYPIVSNPASDMLVKNFSFDIINVYKCFIFASSAVNRGHGKQATLVDDLQEFYQVLKELSETRDQSDNYIPTTPEIIQQSNILSSEDESVRFKTQPDKGKKPTQFHSEDDFRGIVGKLGELLPTIVEKANQIKQK